MWLKLSGILLTLTTFLFPAIGFSGGFKNEPEGFRDIKWGASLVALRDMEYQGIDSGAGEVKVYTRKNNSLEIGKAKLQKIEYNFWQEKFYSVLIYTQDFSNFETLKEFCFKNFEKGNQPNQYFKEYYWFGDISIILLRYNESSRQGILFISSKKLQEEIETYKKQKKE